MFRNTVSSKKRPSSDETLPPLTSLPLPPYQKLAGAILDRAVTDLFCAYHWSGRLVRSDQGRTRWPIEWVRCEAAQFLFEATGDFAFQRTFWAHAAGMEPDYIQRKVVQAMAHRFGRAVAEQLWRTYNEETPCPDLPSIPNTNDTSATSPFSIVPDTIGT